MEQEELYNHCMKSDHPNSIIAEPLLDTEVTKEKSKDNRKILRFSTKLDKGRVQKKKIWKFLYFR